MQLKGNVTDKKNRLETDIRTCGVFRTTARIQCRRLNRLSHELALTLMVSHYELNQRLY